MEVCVGRIRVRTGLVRFEWVKARTVGISKKHRWHLVSFSELGKFGFPNWDDGISSMEDRAMGCVGCKDGFYGKTELRKHDGNNHEAAKFHV